MFSEAEIKDQIVEVGRRLYANRFIAAGDGNISARSGGHLFFTPTGRCRVFQKADDIAKPALAEKRVGGPRTPSWESLMHREISGLRREVAGVVPAPPPYSTGYAVAGIPLDKALLPEVILTMGCIPLA